jgi:hypothetical protein
MDALRAFAMLLGIALHAAMSFTLIPWIVQDSRQHSAFDGFMMAVHGFRMPLFFLVSGFFTALLWRRRGIGALLRQRTLRIFLPCMLGLVTIIPLTGIVSVWAFMSPRTTPPADDGSLVAAIRQGDTAAVKTRLDQGADANAPDEALRVTPLAWAALRGDLEATRLLLERGADINGRNSDGSTPLHGAAFLGHPEVAELLIEKGADRNALNDSGGTPLKSTEAPWEVTWYLANQLLRLPGLEEATVKQGREQVRVVFERHSGDPQVAASNAPKASPDGGSQGLVAAYRDLLRSDRLQINLGPAKFHLVQTEVFSHLWFLWFLCWLVPIFALAMAAWDRLGGGKAPGWLTLSPLRLLWVIPLTLIPEYFMGYGGPHFGPDTSSGLLPPPHLLLYYGLFFAFGVLYFDAEDNQGQLGRKWWLWLAVSLVLLFPAARLTTTIRPVTGILQVLYTWGMSFGLIGLFRRYLSRESPRIRYISDSSYWLYLGHLPLVIGLQNVVRDGPLPALLKCLFICVVTTGIMLLSYRYMVRYTWIGRLLNGPRKRQPAELVAGGPSGIPMHTEIRQPSMSRTET